MKRVLRLECLFLFVCAFLLASCSFLPSPFSILRPSYAFAQGIPNSISAIDLSVSTQNPTPGQSETITARSYTMDINSATVTWTVNGKQVQKGIGLVTYTTPAPGIGKKLAVTVSTVAADGSHASASVTITSGVVDMIIENNGYVPPFFLGKIDTSYQNSYTVTAVPHLATASGAEVDPKTLIYAWQRNGQAIEDQSGYGKQSVTFVGDIVPRQYVLSVLVTSRDGSLQTSGDVGIDFSAPSVGFYVNDPLYGPLFNRAVNGTLHIGSQKEMGVIAAPFGFNVPTANSGDLTFSWLVNGSTQQNLSEKQSLVLRAPDGAGSSDIEVDIQNQKSILQAAKAGFTATFAGGADTATSSVNF